MSKILRSGSIVLLAALLATGPVLAQSTATPTPAAPTQANTDVAAPPGFWLTTPFPELTLPIGQSAFVPQGLSRSQAELRSVQPAWKVAETNAAQVHCPSTSFGQVLAFRLLLGVGEAVAQPASLAYIRQNFDEDQQGLPSGIVAP